MKRRFVATTRCMKITDIAFSSTVNASELKKIIVTEQEPADAVAPCRGMRELGDDGRDWPGTSHSR